MQNTCSFTLTVNKHFYFWHFCTPLPPCSALYLIFELLLLLLHAGKLRRTKELNFRTGEEEVSCLLQ